MVAFIRRQLALLRTPVGRARIARDYFQGAWPVLRSAAWAYRQVVVKKTRVVAVVGSQGKTTTARTVAAALGLAGYPSLRNDGNCFSHIATALLRMRPRDDFAVVEVGISGKGQMRMYAGLVHPDIAIVTLIASEHNSSFGDLSVTRAEKARMVRVLPHTGLAVLNGDDTNVLWMRGQTRARVITYGLSPSCDIYASDISFDWPQGMTFHLHAAGAVRATRTRLIGRVYVNAVLAAVAVGLAADIPLDTILARLANLEPTPSRLEPVRLASGAVVLRDEFKSSLETIEVALDVLGEIPARRKIVVMGDISEPPGRPAPLRRRIGGRIAGLASQAIFLGSSKTCQAYAAGAAAAGMPRERIIKAGNSLAEALAAIPADLGEGDVILIKGRNEQRLGRLLLCLIGRDVRCDIASCFALKSIRCDQCPMLERGWKGLRVEA